MSNTKWCTKCEKHLPLEAFAKNKARKDGLQTQCYFCKKLTDAQHYKENKDKQLKRNRKNYRKYKQELDEYKSDHGCKYCGEDDACCLDFHHPDDNKDGNVATMLVKVSKEKLMLEVAKCEVLCATCHRKIHAGRKLKESSCKK